MISSQSRFETVRGLRYHVRLWGPPEAPPVLLLHGWMDVSASFQFLVDALGPRFRFIAPDWRGFGQSQWAPGQGYVYQDYLADLDALLGALALPLPVPILGHSMGGNIAMLYAAARPQAVRRVINLEGFGLRERDPAEAVPILRGWLDELARPLSRRRYGDLAQVIERIRELSPRISPERARFVAAHWAEQQPEGDWVLRADPAHRRGTPHLYRLDEAQTLWSAIEAPVLWFEASQSENFARHGLTAQTLAKRRAWLRDVQRVELADTGHMMHWEQPEAISGPIAAFLEAGPAAS